MYKIRLICNGVPQELGDQASIDITEEFIHRSWHRHAVCIWDGSSLILKLENDFDNNGRASLDEFSDAITACVAKPFNGMIEIESVFERRIVGEY